MAETEAIARMADLLSAELFGFFGWQQCGPKNQNWKCLSEAHKKDTHPSDVVYWYANPFDDNKVYINTDLKSYAKGSIDKLKVLKALRSMGITIECAKKSKDWRDLFVNTEHNHIVRGLLFLYNHDGGYDGDFDRLCENLTDEELSVPTGVEFSAFGPKRVNYLAMVANDLARAFKENAKPSPTTYQFYYPNLIRGRVQQQLWDSATIEVLAAPWQLIRFQKVDEGSVPVECYRFYYSGTGETHEQHKYLLDYLFRYQLVGGNQRVSIRLPFAAENSAAIFQTARDQYFAHYFRSFHESEFVKQLKDKISFDSITRTVPQFSQVSIGMRDE